MKRFGISLFRISLILGAYAILGLLPRLLFRHISMLESYGIFALFLIPTFIICIMLRPKIKHLFMMNPRKLNVISAAIIIASLIIMFNLPPDTPHMLILCIYSLSLAFVLAFLSVRGDWTKKKFSNWIIAKEHKQEQEIRYLNTLCPKCRKGEMMEIENRFFVFYRCSDYPKCEHSKRIRRSFFPKLKSSA